MNRAKRYSLEQLAGTTLLDQVWVVYKQFHFFFKRLVLAHLKSYRPHLLHALSYDPELHVGKVWARSAGS